MSRILIFALAAVLSTPVAPQQVPPTHSTLMALEGAAFDRAFVAQMIKDQEEAVEQLHNAPQFVGLLAGGHVFR